MTSRLACLLLLCALPAAADDLRVRSHARDIGYMIGDVVTQTVEVETPAGYRLDAGSLPKKLGAGAHVELRAVRHETADVGDVTRHVIRLDWQIFRAMRDIRPVELRALALQFRNDDRVLTASITPARVLISPLLPTLLDDGYSQPRADASPVPRRLWPLQLGLGLSVAGLLLALTYFAWRNGRLSLRGPALPFRRAWHEIRTMRRRQGHDPAAARQALRTLSRAFDAYTQTALSAESLGGLFERHAEMQPYRARIEAFYGDIERSFFAGGTSQLGLAEIEKLARQLSRLERP
jgi:hypothetical protein